jgi:hypothetical protein
LAAWLAGIGPFSGGIGRGGVEKVEGLTLNWFVFADRRRGASSRPAGGAREHDRGGLRSGGPPVCVEARATQGCCRGRVELREGGGLRLNGPEEGLLGGRIGRTVGMLRRARAGRRAVSYSWDSATVHPASMP